MSSIKAHALAVLLAMAVISGTDARRLPTSASHAAFATPAVLQKLLSSRPLASSTSSTGRTSGVHDQPRSVSSSTTTVNLTTTRAAAATAAAPPPHAVLLGMLSVDLQAHLSGHVCFCPDVPAYGDIPECGCM